MQFLAKHNFVKVIECNLRASRSFPFASKVIGANFAKEATRRMLNKWGQCKFPQKTYTDPIYSRDSLGLDYVGVKVPMFSFSRITGADPMLGVEMASTGEVGCLGSDLDEALLHGLLATGFKFPQHGVLLSLGPIEDKYMFVEEARLIAEQLNLPIFATEGTAESLQRVGIDCTRVGKGRGNGSSALDLIGNGSVDLVINIPREYDERGRPDGYLIRRQAIDAGVPLITDLKLAGAIIEALCRKDRQDLAIEPWSHYLQ